MAFDEFFLDGFFLGFGVFFWRGIYIEVFFCRSGDYCGGFLLDYCLGFVIDIIKEICV